MWLYRSILWSIKVQDIQEHAKAFKCLLLSLNTERVEVPDVTDFFIHIVYNRPKSEKTAAQSKNASAIKTSKMGKKTFNDTRQIPPGKEEV